MGGGQSNSRGQKPSLLNALKMIVEDVEFYADKELIEKAKQIKVKISFSHEKNKKKVLDILKQSVPPQINNIEDVLEESISSVFQCSLIENSVISNLNKYENIDPVFVRDFRLMDFNSLKPSYENRYENQLMMLLNGLKCYCMFAKLLLSEIQDQSIKWQIYVLIWEHFQNHLIRFSKLEDYDLEPLNRQFDNKYYFLQPQQKIISIGAKIWGIYVYSKSNLDISYILQQFKLFRRNLQSNNLPFSSIFNAILDMNIDVCRLEWIGMSDFELQGDLEKVVNNLKEDSKILLNDWLQNYEGNLSILIQNWEQDSQLMKQYIPNWVCENFFDVEFFDFFEKQLQSEFKLMERKDLKRLIEINSKPEIQYDFGSQLRSIGYNCSQIIFQFDNFIQKNSSSILKLLIKQLDIQFSSIIMSSEVTQQGNSEALHQQPISDLLRDEQFEGQIQKHIEVEQNQVFSQIEEELDIVNVCRKYDQFKNKIISNIESRNNKIKKRNSNKDSGIQDKIFEDLFDFKQEMNSIKVKEITSYLGNQRSRDIIQLPKNHNQVEGELQSNIAAQILSWS